MHIDITPEALLTQFDYHVNDHTLAQINSAIANTYGFDKFSKHILSLNDKLKHMNAYVALSNSESYFKVKCDTTDSAEIIDEFKAELDHWSNKYDVKLQKVQNKNVSK